MGSTGKQITFIVEICSHTSRAFESGEYHDAIVRCDTREWKVHRVILGASSNYFHIAFADKFKVRLFDPTLAHTLTIAQEGVSCEIELKEDDPAMVEEMLRFLYTSDYKADSGEDYQLSINAKMYAMGEKYSINSLKDLAKAKFSKCLTPGQDLEEFFDIFLEAVDLVYTTTPASDRGLRDCLTPILAAHKETLRKLPDFVNLIKGQLSDGDFAMDVINVWAEIPGAKKIPGAQGDPFANLLGSQSRCRFCPGSTTQGLFGLSYCNHCHNQQ